jgi:2'-5' RNA ligase
MTRMQVAPYPHSVRPAAEPVESKSPTESAIIVAVPEAEPVVGPHRQRFDPAAAWGVPTHVTILYPFIEPDALTDEVVRRVRVAVARVERFTCAFKQTGWFDRDVLWLRPEPDLPFRWLTAAVVDAFPTHLPYAGAFGPEVTPHMTVAESRLARTIEEMAATEHRVVQMLPFRAHITEALLMVGAASPHSWSVAARLPLGD